MTDNHIIIETNERCRRLGLDPHALPVFNKRYSAEELTARRSQYKEVIEVITYFVNKFLSAISGDPFFVAINDNEGYILEFKGDSTIIETVRQLGLAEGLQMNEELGTNAVDLCLRYRRPVQLLGDDHYHKSLHRLACYTAPFHSEDNGPILGTLSIMTAAEFAHSHWLALLCTIVDSIERELLLRRQNTHLHILNQVLLETKYYGVIVTDAHGRIMEMNENGKAMLFTDDQHRERCIGSSVFAINRIGTYFEEAIIHHEACIGEELTLWLNESPRTYMLDVVPIYDGDHRLIRVAGSLRDMTDMKTAEELLRNTEKLVFAGQLAVNIAHEIRNPMTTVQGMLQLSSKAINPTHYSLMMSELERINAIVSEFLILGRPQAEQFKKESCRALLQEVVSIFELQFEMNGITMNVELGQELMIYCDSNQIKQVFLNILKNALEALPFGGSVDIVTDFVDSYQRIRFTDNGVGMTEEVLQRIGDPFISTRPDANGLGMMMVNKIITAHNGRMVIASKIGDGTTVEVFLPGE
ncbi:ATP-binding protein [Paenibacillus alkaliterrae]|uniref:ATP-binding protein n=1 Tax=Paenibacillus alkaliterrae TaxID=320909 RepID=UPI001F264C4D|nr:ATP-binding protein [Paenibacillus alkaliterrae]MCF2941595.1 ATP-binding protein [Paenibacillus alkaliterrae]